MKGRGLMEWNDFIKRKEDYQKTWSMLKAEYADSIRKFLDKSYIDIFSNGKNISFNADAYAIAQEVPGFFIQDKFFNEYTELIKEYKAVEKLIKSKEKDEILEELKEFDDSSLSVGPNRAEIVFPTVDMDLIQEIKKSKYCDQAATNMSKASIRVILIGGDKLGPPW
jgi:hypothetical protein